MPDWPFLCRYARVLCRKLAPIDLGDTPLYIVLQSKLPHDLGGLSKVRVRREVLRSDLAAHPEVLAEAVQTILRRVGYPEPYEALKGLTRGRELTVELLHRFVDELPTSHAASTPLRELSLARPRTVVG